jgi:AraC family transcriptional regulator, activator of mtrCDE
MTESPDDLLTGILNNLNLSTKVFGLPTLCGQWQLNTHGVAPAQFHLITRGSCYLHMRHLDSAIPLRVGDLVVVMHGDWHVLSAQPILQGEDSITPEGKGLFTHVICGQFDFPERARRVLIDLLPPLILVHSDDAGDKFSAIMRLMADEGMKQSQGSKIVLDKLADALFVMVLRHYIDHTESPKGVLAGLNDPKLQKLIVAIHKQPGDEWAIERMLEIVPLSRSAFIERFAAALEMSPMNYVTHCRMIEAEKQLLESNRSVARIATELGYSTESAFRRAFKRVTGKSASDLRKREH